MTEFGELHLDEHGHAQYRHIRTIPQSAMLACPHFIMVPEHYREDNSCRCDDEWHEVMREWGYTWDANAGRWT